MATQGLISEPPTAIKRQGQFVCPVDGCDREPMDSDRAYRLHYMRKHDAAFKRRITRARNQRVATAMRENGVEANSTSLRTHQALASSSSRLLKFVIAVLRNHNGPMTKADLIAGIRAAGYPGSSSDSSMSSYISQLLVANPGLVDRPGRGIYKLVNDAPIPTIGTGTLVEDAPKPKRRYRRRNKNVESLDAANAADIDIAAKVEVEVQRRLAVKNQEIAMKLFEVVMVAMQS